MGVQVEPEYAKDKQDGNCATSRRGCFLAPICLNLAFKAIIRC